MSISVVSWNREKSVLCIGHVIFKISIFTAVDSWTYFLPSDQKLQKNEKNFTDLKICHFKEVDNGDLFLKE